MGVVLTGLLWAMRTCPCFWYNECLFCAPNFFLLVIHKWGISRMKTTMQEMLNWSCFMCQSSSADQSISQWWLTWAGSRCCPSPPTLCDSWCSLASAPSHYGQWLFHSDWPLMDNSPALPCLLCPLWCHSFHEGPAWSTEQSYILSHWSFQVWLDVWKVLKSEPIGWVINHKKRLPSYSNMNVNLRYLPWDLNLLAHPKTQKRQGVFLQDNNLSAFKSWPKSPAGWQPRRPKLPTLKGNWASLEVSAILRGPDSAWKIYQPLHLGWIRGKFRSL